MFEQYFFPGKVQMPFPLRMSLLLLFPWSIIIICTLRSQDCLICLCYSVPPTFLNQLPLFLRLGYEMDWDMPMPKFLLIPWLMVGGTYPYNDTFENGLFLYLPTYLHICICNYYLHRLYRSCTRSFVPLFKMKSRWKQSSWNGDS